MEWTAAAVAAATGGRIVEGADPGTVLRSVAIDSRTAARGSLFVAVRAARDGHGWVAAAVEAGAGGYLYERGRLDPDEVGAGSGAAAVGIEVPDTSAALLDLGRAARARLSGRVVGITGSVGKTSTKDLLAAVLRPARRVTASEKSHNNELGVPLTLANADAGTEVTVVEMGARGIGHIALLCSVTRPTVAVVTAVAAAHVELFGSIDAIAAAKGELVEALPVTGLAVLNADDDRVAAMSARTVATSLRYSATGRSTADVAALDLRVDDDLRPSFTLVSPWGSGRVRLGVRGAHQVANALAAAAVALDEGVPWEAVAEALGAATLSPWRMELTTTPDGVTVLNDAYNANPASMEAALRSLARLPARRHFAVVGAMAELGAQGAAAHRDASDLAEQLGVTLIAVDTGEYGRPPVDGIDGAVAALAAIGPGDAVLVKASRVAGLERLAARLTAGVVPGPTDETRSGAL